MYEKNSREQLRITKIRRHVHGLTLSRRAERHVPTLDLDELDPSVFSGLEVTPP